MTLPKFLVADNTEFPDDIFVVHTEYPRFILNVEEEDVEWLDEIEENENEEEVAEELTSVIEQAYEFYDSEVVKYGEYEEDEEDEQETKNEN